MQPPRRRRAGCKTGVATQRALQVGHHDTWRWRLGGPDDPVPQYRSRWARMVSSVAYAERGGRATLAPVDQTPMVTLVCTGRPESVDGAGSFRYPRSKKRKRISAV